MDSEEISDQTTVQQAELIKYREELLEILHKSQEAFEKQLSYISAGCLVLSIGYVKDIVKDIENAEYRAFLMVGWVFMILTLLMNLVSHLIAVRYYRLAISEINNFTFENKRSIKRFDTITILNWACLVFLVLGILAIVIFINQNL